MKKLYTTAFFLSLILTSFASYKVRTAVASGNWSSSNTWTTQTRIDGVSKDKYIIPAGFTVTIDNVTLGDVDFLITGTLELDNSAIITLGENSRIEILSTGSITANGASQQIFIGNVLKYIANKNKTLSGLLVADKSTGIAPNGFSPLSFLPLEFVSFTTSINNNGVFLKWSTANEKDNSKFAIEKSINGNNWTTVAVINAKGNSSNDYNYSDNTVNPGSISYRIKQQDNDGKFTYSVVRMVKQETKVAMNVFVANRSLNVVLNQYIQNELLVNVSDMNGRVIMSSRENASSHFQVNMNSVKAGIYVVNISGSNGTNLVKQVVIN